MKRILGLLVAVLALAGGGFGSREVDASRNKEVRREVSRAAETAARFSADGLLAQLSDLKQKADNAAANPRLVFALEGQVDEGTMRDLWRTEEWWRPWRTEFKVYAVAVESLRLDVVEGIDAADLHAEGLVRRVRDRSETASAIVIGKGWPYAAAASMVRVPGRNQTPVLLLAKPVDQAVLQKLADKTGGAVVLTDGHTMLMDAGAEAERALLKQVIGSESGGRVFASPDGMWAAASVAAAPGLWLWAFASGSAAAHESEGAATERKVMLWLVAVLIAGLALVIGLRRPQLSTGGMPAGGSAAENTPSGELGTGAPVRQHISGQPSGPVGTSPAPHPTTTGRARAGKVSAFVADGTTLTVPAPPTETPFGRYTLLDKLGEGGMAEVYTAVTFGAEGFRRKFVIKRLRAELSHEAAAVEQFIDEANMASSMVHSNIVPVFDFGKVGEEYYMAQEYILGRDLARITRRSLEQDRTPLSAQAVLFTAQETLKALEYAHTKTSETGASMGIVHRDVSPMNVIVSARGEVKLFDFGIVKAEGRMTKTQSGVVKGNVTFMSPEQARGINVDARADLFSLGLVLFYCLTGQALYGGENTYDLLIKAAAGPGPEEFDRLRVLPDPCGALLHRALQPKPEDRFQSAREFEEAVASGIGGGAAELAALMQHLFSEDFKAEEARFRTLGSSGGQSGPASSGSAETLLRRT